jgi:hypothetical protein
MPRYEVIKSGFYDGKLYDPEGKRKILITADAFKNCPSWLRPTKEESASQREKRETNEAKRAKANADKVKQDRKDIDAVTFVEPPKSVQVETL